MRLPFRRRKPLDVGVALRGSHPVGLTVSLSPLDFLSALPVEFRDTVNGAHGRSEEALRLAQGAEQRVAIMEDRLTEEGTEASRLAAVEAELARVKRAIEQNTGRAI